MQPKLASIKTHNTIFQGDGFIEAIQDRLLEVSLESAEWEQFAQSVLELANSRERKAGSFAKFVTAVEDNDHTIFLDAANIAFFNTMKFMTDKEKQCDERFQWPQVNQVYQLVRETFPASRVMVIAHNYRCRVQFVRTKESRQFLDELQVRSQASCRCGACGIDADMLTCLTCL